MDIVTGLAAVSNGITVAKTMRNIEKNLDVAVMKGQLADITVALSDAKLALVQAKEDIEERNKEIERIRKSLDERSELRQLDGGFQFKIDEQGNPIGYPVCPTCVARESRVIQLVQDGPYRHGVCPNCHTKFPRVTKYLPRTAGGPETAEQAENEAIANATARMREENRRRGGPFM